MTANHVKHEIATFSGSQGGELVGKLSERAMSDGFDNLDATEKAGIGAALNRCRALAAKIANELRNKEARAFR
jgi:hypothetical protein